MTFHEDIYGAGKAIELIIRWNSKIIADFDKQNPKSFNDLKHFTSGQELDCYCFQVKDVEQKVIVPIDDTLQLVLHLEWDEKTFSHKAKVKSKKKSRIENASTIPDGEEYRIHEKCILSFIDINEAKFPSREQKELYERISALEILPRTKIENDLEIWDKWIEAQELIINRNARPFQVTRVHPLLEIKNEKGEVIRYKFKVNLKVPETNEYRDIEEELFNEFKIQEQFDQEGNIELKLDDIFRGLDPAIEKKFKGKIEREKGIGTVLKLRPLPIAERVEKYFLKGGYKLFCNEDEYQRNDRSYSRLVITPVDIDRKSLLSYLDNQGYELKLLKGEFHISNHGPDITKNKEFNKKHKLFFGDNEYGHILPVPTRNVFTIRVKEDFDLSLFGRTLLRLYGKGNVRVRMSYEFVRKKYGDYQGKVSSGFTDEFWQDIKRDLYMLDFKAELNETTETISYDFETKEECIEKFGKLEAINKFDFYFTPDNPEFKFKVKTNLLEYKTQKQLTQERIASLSGVEFQIPVDDEDQENNRRKNYVPCGKLNGYESDSLALTFTLNNRRKEEKKAVSNLLQLIDDKTTIARVEPNLRGDQAKTKWLLQAMHKITNPSEKPNGSPVNEKIGQFLFDSSKAEEVFKDIAPDSEEWNRVKRNELLKLNDSQRKAILTALHARDLALMQGPPGTGKTTVIAELIWQMISQSQEQKILLTSETNLAVDNALEKLLNKEQTLVKPLRFGRDTKFEEEGKKYSFNRIMKWIDENFTPPEYEEDSLEENEDEEEFAPEDPYNNAVQIWMRRIAEKSHKSINPKYESALKNWAIELSQPEKEVKQLFKDKYFKYANVVGSTCSSSGSPSFMKSYQFIFNRSQQFLDDPNKRWNWIPVEFDTVIMDEASKATPPEMLLPLCFGKKSVVIGDHKQLPPMLNDKEFREALLELESDKAKQLAEEINREFVETSQFERLIMNPKVPKSIIGRLNIQYRMHPKINNVIRQFYEGESDEGLFPAEELVQNADDKDLNNAFSRHHGFMHEGFIKPEVHTIWVNVDEPEEQSGTSRINEREVEAIRRILKYLKNSEGFQEYFNFWESIKNEDRKLQEQEIGIISFYGHQVRKLQDVRRFANQNLKIPVRLKTVDKFQGMERNIVIVSTVRSDKLIKGGITQKNRDIGFAKAPERLNVALSRARRLLIVVGNLRFFESYKNNNGEAIYQNAIDTIRKEGMIISDYKMLNKYE